MMYDDIINIHTVPLVCRNLVFVMTNRHSVVKWLELFQPMFSAPKTPKPLRPLYLEGFIIETVHNF